MHETFAPGHASKSDCKQNAVPSSSSGGGSAGGSGRSAAARINTTMIVVRLEVAIAIADTAVEHDYA